MSSLHTGGGQSGPERISAGKESQAGEAPSRFQAKQSLGGVINGAIWLGILQALNYLIPLATVPIITRAFGLETFGVIATILAYAGYAGTIVSYGTYLAAPKRISEAIVAGENLSEVVSTIYMKQALLAVGSFLLMVPPIFLLTDSHIFIVTTILLLFTLLNQLGGNWAFIGLGRMRELTLLNLMVKGGGVLAVYWFIHTPDDVLLYAIINLSVAAASAFIALMVLGRLGIRLKPVAMSAILRSLRDSFGLFMSAVSISVYTNGCVLIVGSLLGPAEAGLYSLADRMRQAVMGVFGPVTQALYPFVCRHVAGKQQADADEKIRVFFFRGIAVLGLALSIGMYYLAPFGVHLLGGAEFDRAVDILRIMSPVPFLVAMAGLLGAQTLVAHGYEKHYSQVISAAGPVGIALVTLGTLTAGLDGAAAAYLIVEIAITTTFGILAHRKIGLAKTFGWQRNDIPPIPQPPLLEAEAQSAYKS